MFKVFILIALFLFPQSGCLARQPTQDTQVESQKGGLNTWDFGKVKEGAVLKYEFILKNESPRVLNIKDINTSCGCTASEVKKKILLAGESTIIAVTFNSRGYSGNVKQFIYVHTDALDKPVIKFTIKAEVVK